MLARTQTNERLGKLSSNRDLRFTLEPTLNKLAKTILRFRKSSDGIFERIFDTLLQTRIHPGANKNDRSAKKILIFMGWSARTAS